jgi:hypothetical protein
LLALPRRSEESQITIAIALFAYNRPEHTRKTLKALEACEGASELTLYVFADGARSDVDRPKVVEVREVIQSLEWAGGLELHLSDTNKGLANSIIHGVTHVLHQHDAIIVLEDDIVLAPNAVHYFESALHRYVDYPAVGSVSGFAHPHKRLRIPHSYPYDTYFLVRNSSWGWATWKDRWEKVQWSMDCWESQRDDTYFVESLRAVGPDLPRMLDQQLHGQVDSWAVRFTLHHFLNGLVSLVPVKSYVENIGMDGSGTHTGKTAVYKNDLTQSVDVPTFPAHIGVDSDISQRFARLYGKPFLLVRVLRRLKRLIIQ